MKAAAEQVERSYSFVRHGEAEHNELTAKGLKAEGKAILDPRLTAKGRGQAEKLAASIQEGSFDVIVSSPLSRALETASILSQNKTPVIVTSLHTETGKKSRCQMGRNLRELKGSFPTFDFSGVERRDEWVPSSSPNGFIHPKDAEDRLHAFRGWLRALPEGRVLVVGHSGFFNRLLGAKLGNCKVTEASI